MDTETTEATVDAAARQLIPKLERFVRLMGVAEARGIIQPADWEPPPPEPPVQTALCQLCILPIKSGERVVRSMSGKWLHHSCMFPSVAGSTRKGYPDKGVIGSKRGGPAMTKGEK